MQYWQVASGNEDRDYHQEFLDFGIAFSGNTAMSKISEGDRIVLRRGSKVVAAGIAKKPESQESLSGSEGKNGSKTSTAGMFRRIAGSSGICQTASLSLK